MSERPSAGIGKRLARYRRLSGLSAQQLSDLMGGELSRGVIANIESGRKTDVTVDQLISLAWALNVPPVVLALPVEEPHRFVTMFKGQDSTELLRSSAAVGWFNADQHSALRDNQAGPGSTLAHALLKALNDYGWANASLLLSKKRLAEGKADQSRVDEDQASLDAISATLRGFGVDLTVFKVDE